MCLQAKCIWNIKQPPWLAKIKREGKWTVVRNGHGHRREVFSSETLKEGTMNKKQIYDEIIKLKPALKGRKNRKIRRIFAKKERLIRKGPRVNSYLGKNRHLFEDKHSPPVADYWGMSPMMILIEQIKRVKARRNGKSAD